MGGNVKANLIFLAPAFFKVLVRTFKLVPLTKLSSTTIISLFLTLADIGIICLTLALGAGYLTKLASATDLLIIFAGLALLVLEFVAVPGFGVLGIAGLIILFYGLYLLLIPDVPVSDEIYSAALDGFAWAIVGGIIVLIMLIRLISQSKMFQKLITKDSNKATLKDNYDKRSKV